MKIVFVCGSHNQTPFSEFVPLVKYFEWKNIESFFVLEENADKAIVDKLRESKIDYYLGFKKNFYKEQTSKKNTVQSKSIKQKLKSILPKSIKELIRQFLDLLTLYKYFSKTDKLIEEIFCLENPDAIILYGDRVMGLTPSAIKWMKKNNKPIVDIQIAVSDEKFLYSSFRQNSFYVGTKNPLNFLFGILFPKHKQCFKNECVLFYSWSMMLILWFKDMLPSNPWYLGQSWADEFLLISQKDKTAILKNCPESSNGVVVGQYSHDALFDVYKSKEEIKSALLKKYFHIEQTEKEIIIFGMPQFYEHHIFDEKKSIAEIEYILDTLSSFTDKLILLSLHPKMPYKNYKYIDEKYKNIKVLKDERLSGTLPVADYFISIFESTISWALMCEVVPVFLDYYELGFDVSKYSAVQNLKEKSTFEKDMQKIFENKTEILKDISKEKELLPPFDGQSGERILTEIRKAIDEK